MKPLVSVWMVTYNHEKYIAEALESVLMQQTNFDFEIVIGEDCSTDQTRRIIKDYEHKYPNIIFPIYHDKNVGGMRNAYEFTLPLCRGKYIACLEGDDYWIDPLKLQKQVDLMVKNPDCSLCFHPAKLVTADTKLEVKVHRPSPIPKAKKFKTEDVILGGGGFIITNSMFFRAEHFEVFPNWAINAPVGDFPLMLLLSLKGEIGYIDDVMSVFRVASVASWSTNMATDASKRREHHYGILKMLSEFDVWTRKKYHREVLLKKLNIQIKYHRIRITNGISLLLKK